MKIRFGLRTLLLVMTAVVVMLLMLRSAMLQMDPFSGRRFNPQDWAAHRNDESPDNPRAHMVADLFKNHLRTGMSRNEVQALLGEPEEKTDAGEWLYILGMWSGFRIDYDLLHIQFDADHDVTSFGCFQH